MGSRRWGSKMDRRHDRTTQLRRVRWVSLCLKALFCAFYWSAFLLDLLSACSSHREVEGTEGRGASRSQMYWNANLKHLHPFQFRSWGRTIQMWPNSWITWLCCARIRASTTRWSTTTAAPWRSTSAGWALMILMWPKPRTTWWEMASITSALFMFFFFTFSSQIMSCATFSVPFVESRISHLFSETQLGLCRAVQRVNLLTAFCPPGLFYSIDVFQVFIVPYFTKRTVCFSKS